MKLRAVKGMNDILPDEVRRWQRLERAFRRTVESYGYAELRTPLLEQSELFEKSTGGTSEVVQKQMFTLERSGEILALRPEGTPSAARVYIGQSMHAREPVTKWYYVGPMFRAEQPQRGRYRQFHQAGCELYGDAGPVCDAEMIDMLYRMLTELGVRGVQVNINSLGGVEARALYRDRLRAFFEPKRDALSPHAQERLLDNPLRILDSKDPRDQAASEGAPLLLDALSAEDREHWEGLLAGLEALGTPYTIDPRLVRGLDYYTRTCFEITAQTGDIGSQNALLGGGRYDGMVASLGGPDVPAIGFAMGLERILLALGEQEDERTDFCFLAPLGARAAREGLKLAQTLRRQGVRVELDGRGNSLKSMLRRANAMGARWCLVFGDAELDKGIVQLKELTAHEQVELSPAEAVSRVVQGLSNEGGSPA
jgi:histidyl-tRNA synthetase